MRAKTVNEFQRGEDPKKSLNIGMTGPNRFSRLGKGKFASTTLDYEAIAEKYKPRGEIKHLLIGEAPPHENPDNYFYIPREKGVGTGFQGFHASLPGLVFKKFLGYVPTNKMEYVLCLKKLQAMGVWVIDLVPEPLVVNTRASGVDPEAVDVLVDAVPDLKRRVDDLGVPYKNIILLNLRSRVNTALIKAFPGAKPYKTWKQFLTDHQIS